MNKCIYIKRVFLWCLHCLYRCSKTSNAISLLCILKLKVLFVSVPFYWLFFRQNWMRFTVHHCTHGYFFKHSEYPPPILNVVKLLLAFFIPFDQKYKAECNTYVMLIGFMLAGDQTKSLFCQVAPSGRVEVRLTVTTSPSGSKVLTDRVFSWPTVTLNTEATVMFGLPFAVNGMHMINMK